MEKVSIIMPSNHILSPLTEISYKNSVQQNYQNLEFLIFINGMNSLNKEKIIEFLKNNNIYNHKIVHLYSSKEVLPGEARSKLISISKGELIVFLDADDIPKTNLVSSKIKIANDKNIDIICSSAYTFSNLRGYKLGLMRLRSYAIPLSILTLFGNSFVPLAVNLIPNSGTMIRRKIKNKKYLDYYPKDKHEDFVFYLNLLTTSQNIALIDKPLIAYNVTRNSLTGNKLLSKIWHAKAISSARKLPLIYSLLLTLVGVIFLLPIIFILEKTRYILNKEIFKETKVSFNYYRY